MHKLRPREARGLGAAGRMADNENAKKPKDSQKRGDSTVRQNWRQGRTPPSGTKDLQKEGREF